MDGAIDEGHDRCPTTYWALGLVLVVYVALCTPRRDNHRTADAWEHHRAVVSLTRQLWRPGNPTFPVEEPSIRYSPYSVVLALLCRTTGLDPYDALSAAGVFNTALLVVALFVFLRTYGLVRIAAHALPVVVGLYGIVPAYAGSLALADLPWHQVNPSAFVLPLVLLMWSAFWATAEQKAAWYVWVFLTLSGAAGVLTHSMTALFGFLGMFVMAGASPPPHRRRLVGRCVGIVLLVFLLCVWWPWFDFLDAMSWRHDKTHWYKPGILLAMLTEWCGPSLLLALATLGLRRHPLVRFCLMTAAVCFGLAAADFVIRSPNLVRLPLQAKLMLDLPIALLLFQTGLLRPSTWRDRLGRLWSLDSSMAGRAALETISLIILVYCLVPQFWSIANEPHLARAYVAPRLGWPDRQLNLRARYVALLRPVAERDVVLSDAATSWPVPSFRGKIVYATHFELFIPNQYERRRHVDEFFGIGQDFSAIADGARQRILDLYKVDWIILNSSLLPRHVFDGLLEPEAVVNRVDGLVLMDAAKWRSLRASRPPGPLTTR